MAKPLKTIAGEMLGDVRHGAPRSRITLERGLTLSLTKSGDVYTLTCGRREIFPSPTELEVIASAFGLLQATWQEISIREWRCYRYSWEWVTVESLISK